jgi:hypothetical protein
VALGRQADEPPADQGKLLDLDPLPVLDAREPLKRGLGVGGAAEVFAVQADLERLVDLLHPRAALARERRPVDLVPGHDLAERPLERRLVQSAFQREQGLELVGPRLAVELAQEAHLRLGYRDRRPATGTASRAQSGQGPRRPGLSPRVDARGQGGRGGGLEQRALGKLDPGVVA